MKALHVVLVLGIVAGAVVLGCTVNPVTGRSQLDLMGEAQEASLGEQLYPRYTQSSLGEVADGELQAYVDGVGGKLAGASHRPGLQYRFNAVNDPAVNAYALPGGKISITRGLLARMDSEDELAAVLGHEIGHVTARHSAQQYTRAMLANLALAGAAVYMEVKETRNRGLYTLGGLVGAQLVLARYSREQERQADELGLAYMVAAGHQPQGMVALMETLEAGRRREPNLVERMFASHPLTAERIATARAAVAAQPAEVLGRPSSTRVFLDRSRRVKGSRPAYDRLAQAQRALSEGKSEQARALLQRSVDEWPADGLLRAYLAAAELEQNQTRLAMTNADRAARDAHRVFYPQVVAGQVFLAGKRFPEALARLDHADELLPQIPEVSWLRGQAFEQMGRPKEAVTAYRRVLQLAPADSETAQRANARLQALGAQSGPVQGG